MAILAPLQQADAFEFVADWHDQQARQFTAMSKDDPRIDLPTRDLAKYAARHHAGSAASMRIKASSIRRSLILSQLAEQDASLID